MADEAKSEEAAEGGESKKKGSPLLLIVGVAVVCLGLGAGGAFFLLGGGGSAEAAAPPEAVDGHGEAAAQQAFKDRVFSLEPFVVNVTGEGYPRYLKLKVELETDGEAGMQELDARLAQVRDTVILMLSSKRLADISDFEGKALLKDDLRDRLNGLLEKGRVEQVLFTEFVVQ